MKAIVKNLFSLGVVQGISLVVPLVLTPYLVSKIGINMFGVISAAQGAVLFFTLVIDFGFNITAVRRIAQANGDDKKIEIVVNAVFFLKLLLLAASFFIFLLIIVIVPNFHQYFLLYLGSFSMVVGQAFLPVWYYQGIEKLNKTFLPLIIFKVLTVAGMFYFVKTQHDAPLVNLIYGVGTLVPGIILYIHIWRRYRIAIGIAGKEVLKKDFKDNLPIFFSNAGVVVYSNSTVLILSFFVTPSLLGIYSVVEKVLQLCKTFLIMVHQIVYPRLCKLVNKNYIGAELFLKKIYATVWLVVFCICLFLFIEPQLVLSVFIKKNTDILQAVQMLRAVSFVVFIISLNMPFYQSLLAYHKDWLTVKILIAGSVVSLSLNLILVSLFNINGAIITMYVTEITVTILLMYFTLQVKKNLYANSELYR